MKHLLLSLGFSASACLLAFGCSSSGDNAAATTGDAGADTAYACGAAGCGPELRAAFAIAESDEAVAASTITVCRNGTCFSHDLAGITPALPSSGPVPIHFPNVGADPSITVYLIEDPSVLQTEAPIGDAGVCSARALVVTYAVDDAPGNIADGDTYDISLASSDASAPSLVFHTVATYAHEPLCGDAGPFCYVATTGCIDDTDASASTDFGADD